MTRRSLLRTGGAAAAGAAAVPALSGRASAQNETTDTPVGGEGESITMTAAIPQSAPTFDANNYVGLFIQVKQRKGSINPSGIASCSFVRKGTAPEEGQYTSIDVDKIWGYNAEIFQRVGTDTEGAPTTLFALAQNGPQIDPGQIYVINAAQPCGDYVQVQLEQVVHSQIDAKSGVGAETGNTAGVGGAAGDEATNTGQVAGDETTTTNTPGFGVLAAVGGMSAAAVGLAARNAGDDE